MAQIDNNLRHPIAAAEAFSLIPQAEAQGGYG